MFGAVVADDAGDGVGGVGGFARLPEEFEGVEADDLDAAFGKLVGDGDVESGPAAVAGEDDRDAVGGRALRCDFNERQVGDVARQARGAFDAA